MVGLSNCDIGLGGASIVTSALDQPKYPVAKAAPTGSLYSILKARAAKIANVTDLFETEGQL